MRLLVFLDDCYNSGNDNKIKQYLYKIDTTNRPNNLDKTYFDSVLYVKRIIESGTLTIPTVLEKKLSNKQV